MKQVRIALIMATALALGGCVKIGAGGKPPAQLLTLTAADGVRANTQHSATAGDAMTIGVPMVPQAIAVNRVAVADGPVAITYVKDAVWVEPPARLFQRLLAETVSAKTGRVVVDPRQFAITPATQLSGSLLAFGIDAQAHQAVVTYAASISRDRGKKLETKRFEARVGVGAIDAMSVGTALNEAANKVAADVAVWVG
jgi:cholesterol transport system auxiliary component